MAAVGGFGEARVLLDHFDVHLRYVLGVVVVAVGCGTFDAADEKSEPAKEPSGDATPASSTASESNSAQTSAPSEPVAHAEPPGTTPPCKVSFQGDVMPRLVATCAQATCHGDPLNRPFVEASSPKNTHAELEAFEFGSIEWNDPHLEYSGAQEPDFKRAIDAWRMCGARLD